MSEFILYRGDCLEIMPTLGAGSVDMVMCDLPYGTTACKWDSIIPFDALWSNYRGLCTGAVVLTASQPFTSALVVSNTADFKYEIIWQKERPSNPLFANKQILKYHENILVFYKSQPTFNPQMRLRDAKNKRKNKPREFSSAVLGESPKYLDMNQSGEDDLIKPKSILEFSMQRGLHPTQKPVALMEYLIRTYTNEGETVLDNCMGSGTTGVACMQSGRNFVGIELNDYAQAAALRILKAWGGDTMRTIYATPYNDETKQATGPSADSGFTTVAEVVEAMGPDWLTCSGRAVVYPGVMFSDYEVAL